MMGILTGCDENQEWLLPWWYSHFRKVHPELPIAFGDLGMSDEGRKWCKERGILIPSSEIPLHSIQEKSKYETLTPQRVAWFRKPLLMKQSPFLRTLWLDLDCQVLENLTPILSIPLTSNKMALRGGASVFWEKVRLHITPYSSGVVLFEKNSPLLDLWAHFAHRENGLFLGDDELLSFICAHQISVDCIPFKYNWEVKWGSNPEAAILHWTGEAWKYALRYFELNM